MKQKFLFTILTLVLALGTFRMPIVRATGCECTQYLINRYHLSLPSTDAKNWNDGYLANNGFVQVDPIVGSIVVMEAGFAGNTAGHVGVVQHIYSNGTMDVRGANHTPPVTEWDEHSCPNVSIKLWASYFGRSDISFWKKYTPGDVNGDGRRDMTLFRASANTWYTKYRPSISSATTTVTHGGSGDIPVHGDYDHDSKMDFAIFRPSIGKWFIKFSNPLSNGGLMRERSLGQAGDIPVPGDYDGDFYTDEAIYRPSTGEWIIIKSQTGTLLTMSNGGYVGDIPVPGDYDRDGKTDPGIYRSSTGLWYIPRTNTPTPISIYHGNSSDIPVVEDYDGDGKTDLAIYRPSDNYWYIKKSSTDFVDMMTHNNPAGAGTLIPGDYDGDEKADPGVYKPSTGQWYIPLTTWEPVIDFYHGNSTDVII